MCAPAPAPAQLGRTQQYTTPWLLRACQLACGVNPVTPHSGRQGATDKCSLLTARPQHPAYYDCLQLPRTHILARSVLHRYLEHVVVSTPDRHRVVFPCHAWFGEADCGGMRGPLERNLLPVSPEDSKERGEPVSSVLDDFWNSGSAE